MTNARQRYWQLAALGLLLMSAAACRPLVTVGSREMIIIFVLIILVIAPLLWRFYRWLDRRAQRKQQSDRRRD